MNAHEARQFGALKQVLQFEIDAHDVTLGQLIHVERTAWGLIREVTTEVAHVPRDAVKWIVESVRSESPITYTLRPEADGLVSSDALRQVAVTLTQGVRELDAGESRPAGFNDEALERARELGRVLGKQIRAVRFSAGDGQAAKLTERVTAHVAAILEKDVFEALGSVEGRLEAVNVHRTRNFSVYDDLTHLKVECLFSDSGIPASEIGAAIGRRVSVFGVVYSREDGRVFKVQVKDLDVFPEPEDLPSADDVAGIVD
jgi:hypothetical protein